jgi:hypothetical protein
MRGAWNRLKAQDVRKEISTAWEKREVEKRLLEDSYLILELNDLVEK